VLDGARNVVQLVGDGKAFSVPAGFSRRLYRKLAIHLENENLQEQELRTIPLGISNDSVPLGSHLIYFWESDAEFERGVRFIEAGLGTREHGILFGHVEAIEKAFQVLRDAGFDPDRLVQDKQLSVIVRQKSATGTLSDIAAVAQAALRTGAPAVRFLGNLGMGREPLPAGEDDVFELEARASDLISALPCVIVCMYDVRTLPGRIIMRGGLQTHPLTVCCEGVRENPYYTPQHDFLAGLGHVH
jgi:hypothetical protein